MLEIDEAGDEGWGLWPKGSMSRIGKVGVLADQVELGAGEPLSEIVQHPTADGVAVACSVSFFLVNNLTLSYMQQDLGHIRRFRQFCSSSSIDQLFQEPLFFLLS
jgi:hypothetical protein